MVEYMVANKIAPSKKEAFAMVQMSKSDPVKVVADMVRRAQEAQSKAALEPGDPGYKDRATMIAEAQETVKGIRQSFSGGGQETPAYTPQHTPGGADVQMSPIAPAGGAGAVQPATDVGGNALATSPTGNALGAGAPPAAGGAVPEQQALTILGANPTPEMLQFFKEAYGYIPTQFQR
jgi:hypothetical protein